MNQEGLIRNISVSILSILIQSFWSFVTLISLSCMKESTWFLFQMKSMVREIILEPLEVPDLHPRSQEHHWNPTFLIFKIVEGYNQIVCILKDQSIGVLKITYVHHPQFIRNILHGSGKWPDLLLSIFQLQRSVIYQFVCTRQDKSNFVIKMAYGHHPWNQEGPLWIRKGSWIMTRSTFVIFLATEKCDVSICMYFARQI